MPKGNKKITLKEYKKDREWTFDTGIKSEKNFAYALIFHLWFLKDMTIDEMAELMEARANLIHSLFTFRDLTKHFDEIQYN